MTEKLFPMRQRCKACGKGLGLRAEDPVYDGLYCTPVCAGIAATSRPPSSSSAVFMVLVMAYSLPVGVTFQPRARGGSATLCSVTHYPVLPTPLRGGDSCACGGPGPGWGRRCPGSRDEYGVDVLPGHDARATKRVAMMKTHCIAVRCGNGVTGACSCRRSLEAYMFAGNIATSSTARPQAASARNEPHSTGMSRAAAPSSSRRPVAVTSPLGCLS